MSKSIQQQIKPIVLIIRLFGNDIAFIMRIDISTVTNKLDETYDEATGKEKLYGVRFFKENGELREYNDCRKSVKLPGKQLVSRADRSENAKSYIHLQRNGVIMLHSKSEDNTRLVKLAQIVQFRDHNSSTWLNVFH